MALTKRIEVGSMNILATGQIEIRYDTIIEEDGKQISKSLKRHICEPDIPQSRLDKHDQRVKDMCAFVHTPEVKATWKAFKESQNSNG